MIPESSKSGDLNGPNLLIAHFTFSADISCAIVLEWLLLENIIRGIDEIMHVLYIILLFTHAPRDKYIVVLLYQ